MASGWDARIDRFQPNGSGIAEVWKSFEMQIALSEVTDSLREQANDMGRANMPNFAPTYLSGVDVLSDTAIGYVSTGKSSTDRPRSAQIDQHRYQTLDKLNH
ncbi:MAG: hypothetical protein IKG21_13195 [Atopobiaceae bacterium]|nr:hypothetical protein [Atopobiaceae bacterium]